MKKYLFFLLSFLFFLSIVYIIVIYLQNNNVPFWCTYDYVEKVYDWDTVLATNLWQVRLLWIDAPEIIHSSSIYKDYKFYWCGQKSKRIAEEKLNWKKILFCVDKLSKDKDKYWRKLRNAMIMSWSKFVTFGLYLLESWYAKVYKYADVQYKEKYLSIEKKLKKEKKWIWSKDCFSQDNQIRQKYTWTCLIKWNISSNLKKYYYFPSDNMYTKVKINKSWEKNFCDYKIAEKEWFIWIQEKWN